MADYTEKKQTGGTAKPIQLISFWSLQNRPGAPLPPTYPFKKSTGEITESGVFLQQHYMALHQNKVFKIPYLRKIVIASSVFSKHTQWFKLKNKKNQTLAFHSLFLLMLCFLPAFLWAQPVWNTGTYFLALFSFLDIVTLHSILFGVLLH